MTPEELEKIEKSRDLKKLTEYVMDIKDDSKEVEKFFASLLKRSDRDAVKQVIAQTDKNNDYLFFRYAVEFGEKERILAVTEARQIHVLDWLADVIFASKKEDIFIELAKRSPSIIEGSKGQRILHIAIDHEAYRCITYLVNNGVDFKERNKEGKTALERLREKGVLIVLDFSLCNKQADVPYSLDFNRRPVVTFEEIVMEKAKRNKAKTLV